MNSFRTVGKKVLKERRLREPKPVLGQKALKESREKLKVDRKIAKVGG